MCLADLKDDGDYKFIVADHETKVLKVYMGTNVCYMTDLASKPTALTTYYDTDHRPGTPVIAVAQGNSIYYFQDFHALKRYDLPVIEFSEDEFNIWRSLGEAMHSNDEKLFVVGTEKLFNLRENGVNMSLLTRELLSYEELQPQKEYFM